MNKIILNPNWMKWMNNNEKLKLNEKREMNEMNEMNDMNEMIWNKMKWKEMNEWMEWNGMEWMNEWMNEVKVERKEWMNEWAVYSMKGMNDMFWINFIKIIMSNHVTI